MRIVHLVGSVEPGRCGVTDYTLRLARKLRDGRTEVALMSRSIEHAGSDRGDLPFLPIRRPDWDLRALVSVLRQARDWGADWVHLQYAPDSFDDRREVALLPLVARLVPGAPRLATTIHEYRGPADPPERGLGRLIDGALRFGERLGLGDREALALLAWSDLVICTNLDHAQAIRARSSALARRLCLVPIGANIGPEAAPEPTRGAARLRLGVSADQVTAVYFGFVHPVKGIETLLQAMAQLPESARGLHLWIIGGVQSLALRGADADGYADQIRALIWELHLEDRVDFTGYLSDHEVARRLQAADFAVLPFNHGATLKSGTLMSCLAFGLPVITTLGGNLGPLRHGESLWLVPQRDPAALAAAISSLAADPAQCQRLGAAGREFSFAGDWSRIVRQHRDLYGASRPSREWLRQMPLP